MKTEIKMFKCSKCGNVATLTKNIIDGKHCEQSFNNDCNCGWVYMKEI